MLWFLRILLGGIFAAMATLIIWASIQEPIFGIPREVVTHPWFVATLVDAYLAFLAFYGWVAWKEPTWGARLLWLGALLMWGSLAIALYLLIELFRIDDFDQWEDLIKTRRAGRIAVPLTLVLIGLGAYALGAGPLA